MKYNLQTKKCPRCDTSGSLIYNKEVSELKCEHCGSRFRVFMPELPEGPLSKAPFSESRALFTPLDRTVTVDYYTQDDLRGQEMRHEVSRYRIEHDDSVSPIEFDPHNPRTQFVLYRLAKKAKNRRRYNRDITKRYQRKLIDKLVLDEILDED